MAAIARFGFEGQRFPANVSTSGGFRYIGGRASGTAVAGSGSGLILTQRTTASLTYSDVSRDTSNAIVVSHLGSSEIYTTFQLKTKALGYLVNDTGGATSVTSSIIVRSGTIQAQYNFITSKFEFFNTSASAVLFTSPVVALPIDVWVPVSFGVKYGAPGAITLIYDGTSYSFTGTVAPTNNEATTTTYFLNGQSGSFVTGIGNHFPTSTNDPFYNSIGEFDIDDIAINNNLSFNNTTGSYGLSDTSFPPYVSCQLVQYNATGSNTIGWNTPSGNVLNVLSSSGDFATASFMPRPILEIVPTALQFGPTNIEGINFYYSGAFREGSSNAYISPYLTISSGSVAGASSVGLITTQKNGSVSLFEKDLGGKITYNEFLAGKIVLSSSMWINKNFFGRGTLGDVRYSSSLTLGDNSIQGDYVVAEYNNLILDAGSIIGTSGSKNGLIIYVKENCIINGTITMDGLRSPAASGSLPDGFHFYKNTSTSSFSETGSVLSTVTYLPAEQLYQAYQASSTSECGITGSVTAIGTNGVNRNCGGGGNGGSGQASSGGGGGTSGTFGGGSGGGGGGTGNSGTSATGLAGAAGVGGSGASTGGNGGKGGGVLYLIVGKSLMIGSTGRISAAGAAGSNATINGSFGGGGGGGGGGGSINLFYGINFVNSGSISVAGGTGGANAGGGSVGSTGGSGSLSVNRILTN